jgi:L-lactate dehydrogenase (cytochrome)
MGLSAALTVHDLKEQARRRVPRMFFEYADGGSWTESTYRANESDFGGTVLARAAKPA